MKFKWIKDIILSSHLSVEPDSYQWMNDYLILFSCLKAWLLKSKRQLLKVSEEAKTLNLTVGFNSLATEWLSSLPGDEVHELIIDVQVLDLSSGGLANLSWERKVLKLLIQVLEKWSSVSPNSTIDISSDVILRQVLKLEFLVLLQVLEFESKLTRLSSGNLTSVSEVLKLKVLVLLEVLQSFSQGCSFNSSSNISSDVKGWEVLELKVWFNHIQFLAVNMWFSHVP